MARTVLRSAPGNENNNEVEHETTDTTAIPNNNNDDDDDDDSSEASLFDKVNNFLDTPILDANNRSDQGAVAETLKEFVRDEPEIAQVTFSVVVVAMMVLVTRVVLSH